MHTYEGTANDAVYGYLPGSWKRYKRTQDTTTEYYIFDGDNVLASYAANGTLSARYLTPGLDENLSMTSGGSTYYYMADGLGSVRNVVDGSQVTQNTYDYYAFGSELAATQGVTSPYQFTGREREAGGVLSQHYYRNRYYLPALGIFAARDAFWADPHQGWGYVSNHPTRGIDPYGLREMQVDCERFKKQADDPCLSEEARRKARMRYAECTSMPEMEDELLRDAYLNGGTEGARDGALGWFGGFWNATGLTPLGDAFLDLQDDSEYWALDFSEGLGFGFGVALMNADAFESAGGWTRPGGPKGNYYKPSTGESVRPDFEHEPPQGPHFDYWRGDGTPKQRIKPYGDELKNWTPTGLP